MTETTVRMVQMRKARWETFNYKDDMQCTWPIGPGVYVIIADGVVRYIGASENVGNRLKTYDIRFGYGSSVLSEVGDGRRSFVVKIALGGAFGSWWMREARLIRRLKPPMNKRGTGRAYRKATA